MLKLLKRWFGRRPPAYALATPITDWPNIGPRYMDPSGSIRHMHEVTPETLRSLKPADQQGFPVFGARDNGAWLLWPKPTDGGHVLDHVCVEIDPG